MRDLPCARLVACNGMHLAPFESMHRALLARRWLIGGRKRERESEVSRGSRRGSQVDNWHRRPFSLYLIRLEVRYVHVVLAFD
jgi:hypothetical protein